MSISLVLLLAFLSLGAASQIPQRDRTGELLLVQNESAGLRGAMAFRVTEVKRGSPAARAGLRPEDLILAVNEVPVYSKEELERTLLQPTLNPGASLVVTFGRFDRASSTLKIAKANIKAE